MDLSKGQAYLITLISIVCVLLLCKRTEGNVEADDPDDGIDANDVQGAKQNLVNTLTAEGAKQVKMQQCRDMGMTEAETEAEGAKIESLQKDIAVTQPKIVWLPDADLLRFESEAAGQSPSDKRGKLIKYETVKNTDTKKAFVHLIESSKDPDKIYIGFRPLEDDKGVYYYVDKKYPPTLADDNSRKVYYEKFRNYIIKGDKESIGFYFMVNIINYEYTSRIKMVLDLLKFNVNS